MTTRLPYRIPGRFFVFSLISWSLVFSASAATSAPELRVFSSENGNTLQLGDMGQIRVTQNEITDARLMSLESDRLAILWNERTNQGTVPFYALVGGGRNTLVRQASYDLLLRSGTIDLRTRQASSSSPLFAQPAGGVAIVQFWTPIVSQYRRELQALGATIYRYLPNNALIVDMSPRTRERVEQLRFVRAVGSLVPADRLEEQLVTQIVRQELNSAPVDYNVEVFSRGPLQQRAVAEFVRSVGGTVRYMVDAGFTMRVSLEPRFLLRLAGLPQVAFVDVAGEREVDYDIARVIGGQDYVEQVAGFSGEGVRAEVLDTGLRETHIAFQAIPVLFHGPNNVDTSHGTSTYGINFGDGTGNPRGRGGVPSAQGILASFHSLTDRYVHTAELLQDPYFAVYQSNSWGDSLTTQYTTISRDMDDILFNLNILICQSQSNAGSQQSRPQAWAKNIVSVGGINHFGSLDMSTHRWGGASIGPAADGRIKPDLAHFYDRVIATGSSSDTFYTTGFGGTSAATPITCSYFGTFFQMWHNGIFGNPTGKTVFDSRPFAATSKAIIINTARQWPFSGISDNLTRTHQGWGLPDVQYLYDQRDRILIVDQTEVLHQDDIATHMVFVPGDVPLRVTMVYKDPPGTTSATLHRINDLSLRVTSPSGVMYWGNNGLYENNWSLPDGEEDHINTVENVFIQDPEPGTWVLEVGASEINEDEHPGTGDLASDFALVASGIQR